MVLEQHQSGRDPTGQAPPAPRAQANRISADALLGSLIAAALVLVSFLASGGTSLAPNTWVELALTLIGVGSAAAVVLLGAPGRAWGGLTLALFAGVAVLTFASITWSVEPATSWVEANRTLSYLAAFGAALALARLFPERWRALVGAVATATTLVAGYALLVKVFPATLDPTDPIGRLRAPFDYWNATGLMAALGLPACLWAGARRPSINRHAGNALWVLRALTVPAIAVLVAVLVLSYGRGALAAAIVGLGCWFALVPLRLRASLLLGVGAAGGAAISLWALAHHSVTHDRIALSARTAAGHSFGLFVASVLALVLAAGLGSITLLDRFSLSAPARHRLGAVLVTLVALIPVAAVAGASASSRGLTGEASHLWSTLSNPSGGANNNPARLVELSNSRPRYWSEGLKVADHALLKGVGARGYATAYGRYSTDNSGTHDAHSYVIETFADFGLIGLALNLALLLAWGLAAARPLASASAPSSERSAERDGLITLLAVVVIFGIHSLIDWTWFIPGNAVLALVCAGWLAGRGPLTEAAGRRPRPRALTGTPAAGAAMLGLATVAVIAAWVIWQPLRSSDADGSALAALSRGDVGRAVTDARTAASSDPLSIEPLLELSAIYSGPVGDAGAARRELLDAVSLQPSNPLSWQQLGAFDLAHHQPRTALTELRRALGLDRSSSSIQSLAAQAQAEVLGSAG